MSPTDDVRIALFHLRGVPRYIVLQRYVAILSNPSDGAMLVGQHRRSPNCNLCCLSASRDMHYRAPCVIS